MMIELIDGLWIETSNITALKESDLIDGQTTIFCIGQSACDGGFVVDMDAEDIATVINNATYMQMVRDIETEQAAKEGNVPPLVSVTSSEPSSDG